MKKAKLIIDGKEIEVEITQEQLDKLCSQKKKTGYERMKHSQTFWFYNLYSIGDTWEDNTLASNQMYESANYYSDKTVAENNARADKLMRQLRRFAVEHREQETNWTDKRLLKHSISYDMITDTFILLASYSCKSVGTIYFYDTKTAWEAIDTFKDDLLWYFTEYKDSL